MNHWFFSLRCRNIYSTSHGRCQNKEAVHWIHERAADTRCSHTTHTRFTQAHKWIVPENLLQAVVPPGHGAVASAYWFLLEGTFQYSTIISFAFAQKNVSSCFLFFLFNKFPWKEGIDLYVSTSRGQNRGPVFSGRRFTTQWETVITDNSRAGWISLIIPVEFASRRWKASDLAVQLLIPSLCSVKQR